jgi:hypothetical protein
MRPCGAERANGECEFLPLDRDGTQSLCGRRCHSIPRGGPVTSNTINITTGVMKTDMSVPKKTKSMLAAAAPVRRHNTKIYYLLMPIITVISRRGLQGQRMEQGAAPPQIGYPASPFAS